MLKKVCFVQMKAMAYFMPELKITPGGAERQIYLISTELAKRPGYEAHLCVADFGQAETLEVKGVKLWRSCDMSKNRLLELLKLKRVLQLIDADVYVFRSADLGVAVGAALVKMLGKKVVYMVANSDEPNPQGLKRWCGALGAMAMAWLYRKADALTVQSEEQRIGFKKYRNIDVAAKVPNLFLAPKVNDERKDESSIILWVGRSDPLKRPDLFIELAKAYPNERFVLVSPATTYVEYSQKCKQKAERIDNLEYLERQTETQLIDLYERAKLMVNTSISEGFSNAMMEALYFKVPLLTRGVDPDEIILRHQLGYACSDRDDFFASFEKMMTEEKETTEMGARGRDYVESQHSPNASLEKLLSVIDPLC